MPLVPAVAVGDRATHGWNPRAYAELLGIDYRPPEMLEPRELVRRLDRVLECAGTLVGRMPEPLLDTKPPERERTVRSLAYHVLRLSQAFLDAMATGALPESWLQEEPPEDARAGSSMAGYAESVRDHFRAWIAEAKPDELARSIQVYYGPQSAHDLLERTTWHAAQHLRQLYVLATRLGVTPKIPLPVDAFEGLPLPESVW